MNFSDYVQDVNKRYIKGDAREHTYRGSLQNLLEHIIPNIQATNEPARIKCGAPDYVLTRKDLPVGYIEAKDIGESLDKIEKTEQLKRYLESLDNLILTDYLEFRFFKNKEKVATVRIAEIVDNTIRAIPENFEKLQTLLIDFAAFQGQTIKSSKKLAEMMAHKARLMRDIFRNTLESEEESTLKDQMKAFKSVLMHDLDAAQFADIYAQTIAYGLFTARLHDETLHDFSRSEALLLIPASNPFLRQLFSYVAGAELDSRVVWIVDALCEVYRATDLRDILKDFGKTTGQRDPILHFYETFLGEYDASLRKARGVWYTPEPVVQFIVRAIDDVLKDHFNLPEGLADTSKVEIEVDSDRVNKRTGQREKDKQLVHKVQLLDVATGTGTFLAEAIKQIYRKFEGMEGIWSKYVDNDLLPRLHGFELLMASYAMCHMKLDLLLRETGYKPADPKHPPRVSVYLTNSLEEYHPDADTLFASWLSKEANAASRIKKDKPIMVAFGNPPYSGISTNMNSWTAKDKDGIEQYKYVDGVHFGERKHWLNDDYVQFIRLGEHYIEKNGEGVLAYITNHSYLDNPTFRGMRWHLLNTFDDIYIVDLHGSSLKGETAPDGTKDTNVFDIQAGVAIMIAVKEKRKGQTKKHLARLHHLDIYGKREDKYEILFKSRLNSLSWNLLECCEPFYFFVPKNQKNIKEYNSGFGLSELFPVSTTGFQTGKDDLFIGDTKEDLKRKITDVSKEDIADEYLKIVQYRPFDKRWMFYIENAKYNPYSNLKIPASYRPRHNVMRHIDKGSLCLLSPRQLSTEGYAHIFIARDIPNDCVVSNRSREVNYIFSMYRYEDEINKKDMKVPNLDPKIYAKIQKSVKNVSPENLFDYIYAVLHAPKYRTRYAEFLKSDFPRIPYPENPAVFHTLVEKGAELRGLHLMESMLLDKRVTTYPVDGDHLVEKPRFEDGKVYINATQYFGNVPEAAWNFYIGGYQPAQKWLKDRKSHNLSIDDIRHYQRIIIALSETPRIMSEIDQIDFLPKDN